jgi:hypothetical protein
MRICDSWGIVCHPRVVVVIFVARFYRGIIIEKLPNNHSIYVYANQSFNGEKLYRSEIYILFANPISSEIREKGRKKRRAENEKR